eukprot:COSAG02_NODE_107_length_36312_cov_45.037942_19_plen_123_part_00
MAAGTFEADVAMAFEAEQASTSPRKVDLAPAPAPNMIESLTAGAAPEDDEGTAGAKKILAEPSSWQNTWEYWGPYWCCRTRKKDRKDSIYGDPRQSASKYISRSGDASGITRFTTPKAQPIM